MTIPKPDLDSQLAFIWWFDQYEQGVVKCDYADTLWAALRGHCEHPLRRLSTDPNLYHHFHWQHFCRGLDSCD